MSGPEETDTESAHRRGLRPPNMTRNVFHVVWSAVGVVLAGLIVRGPMLIVVAGAFAGLGWGMELSRRASPRINEMLMKLFSPVAHPHESSRINSSTWYVTALFLLSLTRSGLVCAVGVAVLGLGDPAAAIVGRRVGKTELVHGRTLEGSLAFAAAGALGALLALRLFWPSINWPDTLTIALFAGGTGALAELSSGKLDDNLTVPVAAGTSALLAAWGLGVPL